jgi:hypothetical protein
MQPKVAIFVSNFVYPPTERFVSAIRKMLPDNLEGYDARVVTGDQRDEEALKDIVGCVRYTMGRAEKLMREEPESVLTASIVPLLLEFTDRSKRSGMQGVIFVGARNKRGNEWLYAHFVGKITAPVEVTHILAEEVNRVLEERGSLETNPAKDELERVGSFIDLLTKGIEFVLEDGTKRARLDS